MCERVVDHPFKVVEAVKVVEAAEARPFFGVSSGSETALFVSKAWPPQGRMEEPSDLPEVLLGLKANQHRIRINKRSLTHSVRKEKTIFYVRRHRTPQSCKLDICKLLRHLL